MLLLVGAPGHPVGAPDRDGELAGQPYGAQGKTLIFTPRIIRVDGQAMGRTPASSPGAPEWENVLSGGPGPNLVALG